MIWVLVAFRRDAPRRTALLPSLGALLGSAGLALLWALAPPPAATAAAGAPAAASIADRGAPAAHRVSAITWGPTVNVGSAYSADMAPALHPTDPLRALLGGPLPLRYTTDGGASWLSAVGQAGLSQAAPVWISGGDGQSALQVSLAQVSPGASLTPGPTGNALNFARSTDSGAHWSVPVTMTIPGIAENLPHLWADANPASPTLGART
jgi:hypothetical protein